MKEVTFAPEILAKINSMTKYPSIPTYHEMGDRGLLKPTRRVEFPNSVLTMVYGTEKIDGTNARIIVMPHRYLAAEANIHRTNSTVFVGSREELLWANGDTLHNPAMGIVAVLRDVVEKNGLLWTSRHPDVITVYYGEVYGHGIGSGSKNYATTAGETGFRLFDIARIDYADLLSKTVSEISAWREAGGQSFLDVTSLGREAGPFEKVPLLFSMGAHALPITVSATAEFLNSHLASQCTLTDKSYGRSEGLVVRTADRTLIAKIRVEDYAKAKRAGVV